MRNKLGTELWLKVMIQNRCYMIRLITQYITIPENSILYDMVYSSSVFKDVTFIILKGGMKKKIFQCWLGLGETKLSRGNWKKLVWHLDNLSIWQGTSRYTRSIYMIDDNSFLIPSDILCFVESRSWNGLSCGH